MDQGFVIIRAKALHLAMADEDADPVRRLEGADRLRAQVIRGVFGQQRRADNVDPVDRLYRLRG